MTAARGAVVVTALNAHADRPVTLVQRPGGPVVVKRYTDGSAARVFAESTALWRSSFGADRSPPGLPEPLHLDPGTGELTMQFVAGEPIGARGDLGDSVTRLPEVAWLLADLHGSGVQVGRVRGPAALVRSCARKVADLHSRAAADDAPEGTSELAAAAERLIARLAPALQERTPVGLVPGHGDFSPRNVLAAPQGLVLIDFDRLQLVEPAKDVAYWGAWTWVTQLVTGAEPSWEVAEELAERYRDTAGRWAPVHAGAGAYRAAALLRIAHGWSALRAHPRIAARALDEAGYQVGASVNRLGAGS